MKYLCIVILLAITVHLTGEYRYNFTYSFRGDAHGRVLLIIPYRVYYESSASVNFIARRVDNGDLDFKYDGIGETGYMMRTSGFGGKTLAILTADYDFHRSIPFAEKKLPEIEDRAPYYAGCINRKKNFQFRILSRDPNSIGFTRSPLGVHSGFHLDFPLQFRYYPEVLNIDFFIYQIMMEILKGYNHPCVRAEDLQTNNINKSDSWYSPPLDYSPHMNRIAPLAARVMKRLGAFRQEKKFRVEYRIVENSSDRIRMYGVSKPDISIWNSFHIRSFTRETTISKSRNVLLRDSFSIHISNPKGNGMTINASLGIID